MRQQIIVNDELSDVRIDKYLSEQFEELTRSYIQKILKANLVSVNDKSVKPSYKVAIGDIVDIEVPKKIEPDILPVNIPLDIIYEDSDVILINKSKRMVVHPAPGHYDDTLVNGLMYHCKNDLSGINGILRPGIVHRIDMDTTGVIIACKNDFAHNCISEQLKAHTITRRYYAIVHGIIKNDKGTIDAPIGRHPVDRKKMAVIADGKNARNAITHYRVVERLKGYTLIECQLETGRTHQIRVHMAYISHPLLGDTVYSNLKSPYKLQGQTLHAYILGFNHPTKNKYMEFEAPLPDYFRNLIEKLR